MDIQTDHHNQTKPNQIIMNKEKEDMPNQDMTIQAEHSKNQ